MMDFVTVEKGKIMAEYITCRRCDSPDCKGCNPKRLETMLENGKFDCLMNENRVINTSVDVEPVRHGRWERDELGSYLRRCSVCKKTPIYKDERGNSAAVYAGICINCGARMDGDWNA